MILVMALLITLLTACAVQSSTTAEQPRRSDDETSQPTEDLKTATFAGGCFWCMEPPFEDLDGVQEVVSGYSGGEKVNPSYEQVSAGETEHLEVVQVRYDPETVTYRDLLNVYWKQIDPTDAGGQFADRGQQYRTAIFYHSDRQQQLAERSMEEVAEQFDQAIATEIRPFEAFYQAERYHQDYHEKNPVQYKAYKRLSGRKSFINDRWNDTPILTADELAAMNITQLERKDAGGSDVSEATYEVNYSDAELRSTLSEEEYEVIVEDGTESAFDNEYWNTTEDGIYVDRVSGEPLFSSTHKYKSGTGWPSFYKPLEPGNIETQSDYSMIIPRTEVRSVHADSHLGHVFNDGPEPTGKRYCLNSAALEFIPAEELEERGYEEYTDLFEDDE